MTDATSMDKMLLQSTIQKIRGKHLYLMQKTNSCLDGTHSYSLQSSFLRCIGHISTNRNNVVSLHEINCILHNQARME